MLKAPRAIRPKKPLHVDFVSTRGNRFNSRFGPRILRIPTDSRQNKTLDSSQPGGSQDGSPSNGGKLRKPRESQSQRNDRATGFTWFTRNPSLVNLDTEEVELAISNSCAGRDAVRTILMLATPSLADLVDSRSLHASLIEKLVAGRPMAEKPGGIKCVSAVVDSLPVPVRLQPLFKNTQPPSLQGREGFAVFLSSRDGHAEYPQNSDHESAGHQSSAKLTFRSNAGWSSSARDASLYHSVSLPVANTIFVNTKPSTLNEELWKPRREPNGHVHAEFESSKRLDSFELNLNFWPEDFRGRSATRLRSLTTPRKIVKSMGNVLSQIEVDGCAVPASQELEKAVTAFVEFNPESTARGPLLVYALIRPEGNRITLNAPNVPDDIWLGNAKIFKVSGGGGGWGARQGLLSLDAAADFHSTGSTSSGGLPDIDDYADEEDSGLGIIQRLMSHGVVAGPSTVEFLVHCPTPIAADASPNEVVIWSRGRGYTIVTLGTATDPGSQDASLKDSNVVEPTVRFVPGHFGMISYHGAILSTKYFDKRSRHVTAIAESRLDVPDSQFVLHNSQTKWKPVDLDKEIAGK